MNHQHAERASTEPAEDTNGIAAIAAMPLYGPGNWREQNQHLFASDPSLRWTVAQHREELERAGALAVFAGRVCAVLPKFNNMILQFAQDQAGYRTEARQRAIAAALAAAASASSVVSTSGPTVG